MVSYGFVFVIAIVSSFFSAGIVFLYMNKKTETTLDQLLQKLDRAIHGEVQKTIYDESLDTAITERLNHLLQITEMHKEQAEKERDIIKTLISNISHQIRTPLSNIMLYTELLKEQRPEVNITRLTDKIQKHSEKLNFFMEELIKASYAEQGIISVNPTIVSIEELINMACQNIELAALKKGIIIQRGILKGECYADKKWTVEALENLLENAIKYSKKQSVIQIRLIRQESFLCIEIEDQGIGIAEEEQGRVFERFYRSEQVGKEPGFGIGLYLVREVLSKQGRYIKLVSKLGKGTKVSVYLLI